MSASPLPPEYVRKDWPRLVATKVNGQEGRLSSLEAVGAEYAKARTVTATATVGVDDYLILADATAGALTVNLPATANAAGRWLIVKKIDASGNAVTLDPNGAETIDGAATKALAAQYDGLTIHSDGAGWWIV